MDQGHRQSLPVHRARDAAHCCPDFVSRQVVAAPAPDKNARPRKQPVSARSALAGFRTAHARLVRAQGYRVSPTNSGPDGGVDLVLRREGETFLVQCKRWRATSIGVTVVRELYGVMASRGATGGFVVGVGEFTVAARQFAAGQNITLIDARAMVDESAPETAEELAPPPGATAPDCPSCGAHMKRRTAKRGPKRGQEFYGCSRFPQCRQTQDIG